MKVLVLGGGQVANAVMKSRPPDHEAVLHTRATLDIVNSEAVERLVTELNPDCIVNAAAFTAVDLAEDQAAQAVAVNDTAVASLARAAALIDARLLHLSTDFVFDGASSRAYQPDDVTGPLSVYGTSKRDGEKHVLDMPEGIVVRTSWVYASSGKNFVLTMLRLMREKSQLSVVSDQIGAPTWAAGLAAAIWSLLESDGSAGMQHWTDLGVASWYDFAVAIQEEALIRKLLSRAIPITPIASSQYPTRATRPAFSVLDTAATRALIKAPARHWRHNLRTMLDELRAA